MTQHVRASDPPKPLSFSALSTTLNNVHCHFLVLMEQARNLKNGVVSIQVQLRSVQYIKAKTNEQKLTPHEVHV